MDLDQNLEQGEVQQKVSLQKSQNIKTCIIYTYVDATHACGWADQLKVSQNVALIFRHPTLH